MRGQALILFIVSLIVLCVGVIVLFNTGQAVSKKVELTNAADAAAYSAAIEQARAYNLIAYMNRAEVANEVAVAQIVTIYSMTNYVLSATKNLKNTARNLSYALYVLGIVTEGATVPIANAFSRMASVLGRAQNVIQKTRDGMQQPFSVAVQTLSVLNDIYRYATQAIAKIAPGDAAVLANQIVEKNTNGAAKIGARGKAILLGQFGSAEKYVRTYSLSKSPENQRGADRFANVVMEARDGFSRERNGDTAFGAVKKRGGTDLVTPTRERVRYYSSWVAADTLDFYLNAPWPLKDVDLALAWGGAAATKNTGGGFSRVALQGYGGGRGWNSPYTTERGLHIDRYAGAIDNHKAGKNVRNDPAVGGTGRAWLRNYQGLHDYVDIDNDKATVPYLNGKSAAQNNVAALDVGPVFTVLVEQPVNTVRTSTKVDGIGGPPDLEVPDRAVGDVITALSSAQVYFNRPRPLFPSMLDDRRELGSLFSPYWQARLVDTSCNQRQAIGATYEVVIASCVPGS